MPEKPIIKVKNLSKQYHIGADTTYKTLRDSITNTIRHPLQTGRENIYFNGARVEQIEMCTR